jgi:F-type H+-transporting ATPase subunit a
VGESEYLFELSLFGHKYGFSQNIIVQWAIILIVWILCIILTRGLKKEPGRKQSVAELLVEYTNDFVKFINNRKTIRDPT